MAYDFQTHHHEEAALREEKAAARAACEESARRHRTLATMHRNEAARRSAVHAVLRAAFGD